MAQFQSGLVQFKTFLVNHLNEVRAREPTIIEARRFVAPVVDGPGAYGSVCGHIEEYVTSLQGKTYSIYWKDEDGDFIRVSTDQEITHAIGLMLRSSGVVKLYAVRAGVGVEHSTATCDGCQVYPIRGYRYKCQICPDYDLCAVCEARGTHPEHNMTRHTRPIQLTFDAFDAFDIMEPTTRSPRRVIREMLKSRAAEFMPPPLEECGGISSTSDDEGRCHYEKRARHHKDKHGKHKHSKEHKGHRRHGKGSGRPYPGAHCMETLQRVLADVQEMANGGVMTACDAARAATSALPASSSSAPRAGGIQFPFNIGAFLDPLGSQGNANATAGNQAAPAQQTGPNVAFAGFTAPQQQPDVEIVEPTAADEAGAARVSTTNAIQNLISAAVQNAPNILSAVQQITESLAQQHVDGSSERDGWTVLNADGREQSPASSIPPQGTQQEVSPTSEAARLYPDLAPAAAATAAGASAAAAAASATPTAPHRNPMVQRGLETLIAMGFSNESNMLTQLLEIHNGDIYKALDVLQVIRK